MEETKAVVRPPDSRHGERDWSATIVRSGINAETYKSERLPRLVNDVRKAEGDIKFYHVSGLPFPLP